MKKSVSRIICVLIIFTFALSALAFSSVNLKSISLNTKSVSLNVGKTHVLKVTLNPANSTQKQFKFSTNNKLIAGVDSKGKITALKPGKATITVVSAVNNSIYAKCVVTVAQEKSDKLIMYLLGDKPVATDEIYAEVNKKLKNDINTTLAVRFLGWSEWANKYNMLFASGENFDLIYTSNWSFYSQIAQMGGFLEITEDMLKKYAPKTLKNTPKTAWSQAKLNGKIYMLPNTHKDFSTPILGIRGDLREKYNLPEIKTLDDYINYLDVVAKNEKGMFPLDLPGSWYTNLISLFYSYPNDIGGGLSTGIEFKFGETKLENTLEKQEFLAFVKKMKEFKDKGYWSANALNSKTSNLDSWKNGKSASAIWNLDSISKAVQAINSNNPSWKAEMIDGTFGKKITAESYISNGMGLSAYTKKPEKSLMVLDLFKNNSEYYNLIWYGIEGKHYNLSDKKRYVKLTQEGVNKYPYDSACQWGWKNTDLHLYNEGGASNFMDIRKSYIERDAYNPLRAYTPNVAKIKTETAALANVAEVYLQPLVMGFLDPVKGLDDTKIKLEQAGINKVMQELQTQVNAYIKQ